MSVELADSHLRMIAAIQAALAAEIDAMHDAMDRAAEAGSVVDDDEPVRHVLSALLTVAHNYVQCRSATTGNAELALQFMLAVNAVAGDLAAAYFDADVEAEPLVATGHPQ